MQTVVIRFGHFPHRNAALRLELLIENLQTLFDFGWTGAGAVAA